MSELIHTKRTINLGDRVVVKNDYYNDAYFDKGTFRVAIGLEGMTGTVIKLGEKEDGMHDGRIVNPIGIKFDESNSDCHDLRGRVRYGYGYWLSDCMVKLINPMQVDLI